MKASMGALARQTPAVLCAAFLVGMRLSAQPTDIQPVQPSRTVILRSASVSATVAVAGAPDLDSLEKYCQGMHCVAHPKGPDEWSALDALAKAGLVTLEEFPEATKVHFAQATFDADTGTFDRDFPGIAETDERSAMGQWTVLLKAFLDPRWRTDFTNAGFVLGESVGPMAYQLYGPQDALDALKAQAPYIARVAPVPFGIKRIRVDDRSKDDQAGAPVPTTVVLFAIDDVPALRLLSQKEDRAPSIIYATGATVAYSVRLTADEALYLSTFAEVIAVERRAALASPSDERSNVVIGGGFQSPDTSWPLQLGPNSTPPRWAGYLSSLASLGIDPARQTIAFLDSGIDSGPLQTCPPRSHTRRPECAASTSHPENAPFRTSRPSLTYPRVVRTTTSDTGHSRQQSQQGTRRPPVPAILSNTRSWRALRQGRRSR